MPEPAPDHVGHFFADLRSELALARAELDAAMTAPLLTREEKDQLQDVARSGAMGRELQAFADDVRRGRADWESFLRGRDGRPELLGQLVEQAREEFGEEARAAMAASDPPDDIDDPRTGARPAPRLS